MYILAVGFLATAKRKKNQLIKKYYVKIKFRATQRGVSSLKGNWSGAVITSLVYTIVAVAIVCVPVFGPFANLFLVEPIAWGLSIAFLDLCREGKKVSTDSLWVALRSGMAEYKRITFTLLLMALYVMLWCLLLYVPGIIKMLSYSLTYYILKDEPELKYNAAIEKSMAMMQGNKMKLFKMVLILALIGMVASITIVGIFWFIPYAQTAMAAFYEDVKKNYQA